MNICKKTKKLKKNKVKSAVKENINLILFLISLIFSIFLISAPIILGNANSLNTNTTYENNFTHLNISNSSIVAYYPFDDNVSATTVYDYTNNSNDGTVNGGAVYNASQAIYGGAMTFDGVNDFINVTNKAPFNFERTNSFSISAWVKLDEDNVVTDIIFAKEETSGNYIGYAFYISSNTVRAWLINNPTTNRLDVNTIVHINNNSWQHVAMTYNGSSNWTGLKLYINGLEATTTKNFDSLSASIINTKSVNIGTRNDGANLFNGLIDEVMIWKIALNSTEVLAIYNNQTNRFFPTGEMNYTGVNFAGNDTINITLAGCQQNMGTSLRAKVNDGAYVNFDSSCFIKDYNATGNLNSANITIGFVSDANKFYTPLVIGNISLDSRDVIVPNLTINFPTNNSFSSITNLSINFTAQSNDLSACWYSNDTYTANTTLANCQTNITTVQWAEGQHNVTIWVNDTANSVNSSMVTFTIDATFPTWTANETNLTPSTLNGKGVYFNITLTETNPSTYIFSWYNGTAWENTSASYTNNQEVSISKTINIDIATINWTWYINDSANNLNQTDIWSVTLLADDNVAPNISFANPTTNATNLSQNFIFANLSFADATSSISMANISLFNSTQNIINSTQGTTSTLEINFTGLADGTYYLNASVNDSLGNKNYTETRVITLDTTYPNITFATPTTNSSNFSRNFIYVNLSFADINLGIANISLFNSTNNIINSTQGTASTLEINFTGLSDGIYYINATVNDSANNINKTETRTIQIDTTFPTMVFINPTTNASNFSQKHIEVNLSFVEINLNVTNISLYNSTGNIINSTIGTISPVYINFSGLVDGTYYFNATISDFAGNINYSETRKVILDTTAPTFTINNPNGTVEEDSNPVLYSITTSESSACQVSTDSNLRQWLNATDGNITHTMSLSLSNDYHTANFYCNDTLNNGETNGSVTFYVHVVSNYPSTLGGGNTPTYSPITIIGALIVNFTNMSINTSQSNFYIDFKNKINIRTFDSKGNLTDVDSIKVILLNNISNSINVFGKGSGKYVAEVDIFELKSEVLKFDIIATKGQKTISRQFEIFMSQKDFKEILTDKVQGSLEYVNKNKLLFVIFVLLTMVFFLLLFFIFKKSKKDKKGLDDLEF